MTVRPNDGLCWPRSEGRWLWTAQVGTRILEGCAATKDEAEREGRNAERQMESEG